MNNYTLMYKIILLSSIMHLFSCQINKENDKSAFVDKLKYCEISSIKIYKHCVPLNDSESNDTLVFVNCLIITNLSPKLLITKFNKVDSIYNKQEIYRYREFLLNYKYMNKEIIKHQNDLDIRIALLVEFQNKSVDTLSFVSKNAIQVNEYLVLDYSQKIKSIFQNKYDNN